MIASLLRRCGKFANDYPMLPTVELYRGDTLLPGLLKPAPPGGKALRERPRGDAPEPKVLWYGACLPLRATRDDAYSLHWDRFWRGVRHPHRYVTTSVRFAATASAGTAVIFLVHAICAKAE